MRRRVTMNPNLERITLYTIGFTQKSAEQFFETLRRAGVKRVLDVRLNNLSQLAGFSKQNDLAYFLRVIGGIGYEHRLELAPTQEMLDTYKKRRGDWRVYEEQFLQLMSARRIAETFTPEWLDGACLLCSEATADRCHRRLIAEYLQGQWGNVQVVHL